MVGGSPKKSKTAKRTAEENTAFRHSPRVQGPREAMRETAGDCMEVPAKRIKEASNINSARKKQKDGSPRGSELPSHRSGRGRAPNFDTGEPSNAASVEAVKCGVPGRLFATDRYPSGRVNMYSTVDYLLFVRDALSGSPEMGVLMDSCFGGLFKIPVWRLLMGKAVHCLMTRQLVTKKKYEMWHVLLKAEHKTELVVKPFMSMSCSHDEMWAEWDDERSDKKVDYILKLLDEGHVFTKAHWGRGALR